MPSSGLPKADGEPQANADGVEIHIGSPDGKLFAQSGNRGSMPTGGVGAGRHDVLSTKCKRGQASDLRQYASHARCPFTENVALSSSAAKIALRRNNGNSLLGYDQKRAARFIPGCFRW